MTSRDTANDHYTNRLSVSTRRAHYRKARIINKKSKHIKKKRTNRVSAINIRKSGVSEILKRMYARATARRTIASMSKRRENLGLKVILAIAVHFSRPPPMNYGRLKPLIHRHQPKVPHSRGAPRRPVPPTIVETYHSATHSNRPLKHGMKLNKAEKQIPDRLATQRAVHLRIQGYTTSGTKPNATLPPDGGALRSPS